MEKTINTLKEELKKLAVTIHNDKFTLKRFQREEPNAPHTSQLQLSLYINRLYCRHRHIAYSMLKGRTYEQIEPKCREDNKPNMKLVQGIINEHKTKDVCACA